ncbi:hypothetical protein GCM10027037_24190 [Mucilaginibacter koreensis]
MRLAIITSHPIQYYAPVFQLLSRRGYLNIRVFYTWGKAALQKHDPGFNKTVEWDIPLLEGYSYEWAENTSAHPGSHHFKGIVTPGLIKQIALYEPDAVLVFGWAYHSHLQVLKYFKGKIPVYFRGDSTLLDANPGLKSMVRAVFLRWVYSHVNHAFYAGTNNKAYFQKYGLRQSQLSFAPHAVDNERFATPQPSAALIKKELHIEEGDIVILFSGKLEEKKNPHLLLSAFLQVDMPNLHLIFAGDGELKHQLQLSASTHKKVHFLGFKNQSEMPALYQLCDIFCLPSKGPGETWGLAVNEAMACGKAVIASDRVGCAVDLVTPHNGEIFKSGDIKGLVNSLRRLAADKHQLKAMGSQSAILIKSYNFKTIAEVIETIILQQANR